jgi:drug/metabolite transporter (DMT)-like permease
MNYILLLLNIILLVGGQLVWKKGVETISFDGWGTILQALLSPYIIVGIFFYAMATGIWIYLLSKLPLSFLYPLQSLAYVFGAIAAVYLFQENVSIMRWVGIGIIIVGVAVVAKSA